MSLAMISHSACQLHDMGAGHPEQPARLAAIESQFHERTASDDLQFYQSPRATLEQLSRVHALDYIQSLRAASPDTGLLAIDADTFMGPGTWEAALRSAGAVVMATDLVMTGDVEHAFCNTRPPGHHAEYDRAMGFCFFNNVAVGAAHALEHHAVERVAIIDFDVHFGNGTADIARRDPRMLLCSLYQHPLYPGQNPPTVPGREINCPLPAGSDGRDLRALVEADWLPALRDFQPRLLYLSAGFDAAAGDPLAGLQFTADDYAWLTQQLCAFADQHCDNRVISALEGGYDLDLLSACAGAHIEVLMKA